MAAMMETMYSTSGFTSENSLSGHPHTPRTPPCTPSRSNKAHKRSRLERSDSPASATGSQHPAQTISPGKKPAKRIATNNIKIEEIAEGDVGYMGDVDVVNPDEVEEIGTSDCDSDGEQDTASESDTEAEGLARNFSVLECNDREAIFEEQRRRRRRDKRILSRLFKRSHSQSVKSETENVDVDAMGDHDLESSKRRLRRRTRGPGDAELVFDELPRSSPSVGQSPEVHHDHFSSAADSGVEDAFVRPAVAADDMEIDDAK